MAIRAWTVSEERHLARLAGAGAGAHAIASALGRPLWSVRRKAVRLRVSLRRTGERRGKVLGEPRSGSWANEELGEVRARIAAGREDPGQLERVAAAMIRGEPICPACGARPIDTPTGFCRPCHAAQILKAYNALSAHREADRALAAARSERRRRRADATRARR